MEPAGETVLILNCDLAAVERLGEWVGAFCARNGVPGPIGSELNLVLEEIVINVIQHGRPESPEGAIRVSLRLEDADIVATVADRGAPFNPLLAPEPDLAADLEQRDLGGLGIHLVRRLVSSMEYRRREGQNCLTLRKRRE
jgi:anti-sigma regulatory factor (Ser/Thr protein kinase)